MTRAKKQKAGTFTAGNKAAVGNNQSRWNVMKQQLWAALHDIDSKSGKTKLVLIVDKMVALAIAGDTGMINAIWERIEGKVANKLDATINHKYDLSVFTDAELKTFRKLLEKAAVIDPDYEGNRPPTQH